VHYKLISGSNNKQTFKDFVIEMVRKIKGEAVVYMDNLGVHHTRDVRLCFPDRVLPRYLPKYSCVLNPIEHLWGIVKEKWRRAMLEHLDNLDHLDSLKLLKSLLEEQREKCKSLASCHLRPMI
jgi:transposase